MEDMYRSQFRLPYSLYEQLRNAAEKSGRSLNAEVVFRLAASFEQGAAGSSANPAITHLAARLAHPDNRQDLEALLVALHKIAGAKEPDGDANQ